MKVSLNWLNDYVDLSDVSIDEISEALPMLGLEVESVQTLGLPPLKNVVVGQILSRDPHPDSDHLGVCMVKVDKDAEPIQIVCGASNYKVGDRVPVALDGAELPTEDGKGFKIKVSKLRGVVSNGMMCSARELGLGSDHSGLLILQNSPEIGTPINDVFTDTDTVFEVELTANRGDCASHIGIARELAAKFSKPLKMPELKAAENYSEKSQSGLLDSVELDTQNCPFYLAACIRDVKIAESPEWMKKRLEAVGLRPINNVVDVTNYVLMEYGQPLHSFDAAKIREKKIRVRQADDGEVFETLDEKTHTLTPLNTMVCDGVGPVAIAGVMGGKNSEVTDETTDLVIESAYFNPGNVRATSRKLNINTDSSYRFARDVDPQGTIDASRRAVDLICSLAGGHQEGATIVAGKPPRGDRMIEISLPYIIDRIGFDVLIDEVADVFRRLGFTVEMPSGGTNLRVTVPSFRCDVDRPIDLVEEFIRLYGSEHIPTQMPLTRASLRNDDPVFTYARAAADYLSAEGFNECVHYTLRSSVQTQKWHDNADILKLANPLTADQDSLRTSLLDGLAGAVALNIDNANSFYGFFENGRVFAKVKDSLTELVSTAFVFAPDARGASWTKRPKADFFTAKKTACDMLSILGVDASRLNFKSPTDKIWQDGFAATCGAVDREGFKVSFGALNLGFLKDAGIDGIVFAGELLFRPEVAARKKSAAKFTPFSSFPPSERDVALIVPKSIAAADLKHEIVKIAKAKCKGQFDLEDVNIFDLYSGKGVEDDKKSMAFSMRFRSATKTLKAEEVNKVFEAICAELSKKYKLRA